MAIKAALLSGKGGSGKTTLALSLSKLLSKCGIKVTLIDCDFATCGATYFFEKNYTKNYFTLYNLDNNAILYQDSEYFHFIPVSLHFPCTLNIEKIKNQFDDLVKELEETNEIILFDCQAGYSEILESVLQISDINLIIMEPDPISATAVRVLYARTSEHLESRNTYQIYSKVPDDELEKYENPTTSMFTCLKPIRFNWTIRASIGLLKIPELLEENTDFGTTLYELAQFLLPEYKNKLSSYGEEINLITKHQIETQIENVKRRIAVENIKVKQERYKFIFTAVVCACLFTFIIDVCNSLFFASYKQSSGEIRALFLFIILAMFFAVALFLLGIISQQNMYKRQNRLYAQRDFLYNKLNELQNSEAKKLF